MTPTKKTIIMLNVAGVAQLVEQLICNQQVIRSNRITGSIGENKILRILSLHGEVPKWLNGADCRSVG